MKYKIGGVEAEGKQERANCFQAASLNIDRHPDVSPSVATPTDPGAETPPQRLPGVAVAEADLAPRLVTDIPTAKAHLADLKEFVTTVLVDGIDYGRIPGTTRNALYKPGAEKLLEAHGYTAMIRTVASLERWERGDPFFHYQMACDVYSKRTGTLLATQMGSCNSLEARYHCQERARHCPLCTAEVVVADTPHSGGGWVCHPRIGGCGERFAIDDPQITTQLVETVEHEDPYRLVNTILKVAAKRAMVAAVLVVTRSSDLFVSEDDDEACDSNPATRSPRETNGDSRLRVRLRGREYLTAGITGATLLRVRDGIRRYDHIHGTDAHKALLRERWAKASLLDLTDQEGLAFVTCLDAALKRRIQKPSAGDPSRVDT